MSSTYTTNLRLTKQGTGDNNATWGTIENQQVIDLLDQAISGVTPVDCTGSIDIDLSLVTANGASDIPRNAVLELTGLIGANINVLLPALQKLYFIRAAYTAVSGQTINVKCKGGSLTINFPIGKSLLVYTNGVNIYGLQTGGLQAVNNLSDLNNIVTAQTNLSLKPGVNVQAQTTTLQTLSDYNTNGLMTQTAVGTFTGRTLTDAGSGSLIVTYGDGVLGNPTIDLAQATTSLKGGAVLTATADVQAGVDSSKVVTTAALKGAIKFSNSYVSPQQNITVSTITTLTHGLANVPTLVAADLVCVTTNLNYAVGDVVPLLGKVNIELFSNATSLGIIIGTSIQIMNKTTRALASITPADWKIVLRAWG